MSPIAESQPVNGDCQHLGKRQLTIVSMVMLLLASSLLGCRTPLAAPDSSAMVNEAPQSKVPVDGSACVRLPAPNTNRVSAISKASFDESIAGEPERIGVGIASPFDACLQEQPLDRVLHQISNPSNFHIVGNRNQGVTANIRAETPDEALRQLEQQSNVLVVKQGERYIVYAKGAEEELADESITYLYKCRNARSADLLALIEAKPPEGLPAAGQPYLGKTTVPTQARAAETTLVAATALKSPLGQNVEYQVVPHFNGILLRGKLADIRTAVHFLEVIDRPIPVVDVELMVVQYLHEDSFTWRYNVLDGQVAKADPPKIGTGPVTPSSAATNEYGPTSWGLNLQRIGLSASSGGGPLEYAGIGTLTTAFKQNIKLLVHNGSARVVTNPHVVVINGHTGTILLNQKLNFFTSIINQRDGTQTQQKNELDGVTAFTVTPTIVDVGQIHMAVNSTLSAFQGSTIDLANRLPTQRINDLASSVVLANGETLIIGGLVAVDMEENRDKIPGLASIPLLGHLFRGKDTVQRYTETVIYVTPRLAPAADVEVDHLEQVFQQTDLMQQRGDVIRNNNRVDQQRSNRLYRQNEKIDFSTRKANNP